MSDEDTETIELEVSKPVAEQIDAAATLVGTTREDFVDEAVLNRLQAIDNILHDDAHVDIPPHFDPDAWRERYEEIRRPDTL